MLPVTPRPHNWSGVSVSIAVLSASCCSFSLVVRGGLEPTTDDSSDRHASFTPPDRNQSGWSDSNRRSRVPKTRGLAAALHPVCQSERPDLNRRSPGPRPGAIPGFATFCRKYPVGESNPCWRIESPLSCAVRRTGHVGAYTQRKVGREALESSSPGLQPSAIPSQLPAQILW